MKKKNSDQKLQRATALFALKMLTDDLRSDVLAGGGISTKFNIPTHRPAQLGPDISLSQDTVLDAFRQVLAGKEATPLSDNTGKAIDAAVSVATNGTGNVKIGENVYGFAYVGLLSPEPAKRLEYLEGYLKQRSLASAYGNELRVRLGAQNLTNDEFLAVVETLATSQESFMEAVRGRGQQLTNSDLLPDDRRHWDNLIAPLKNSTNLQEFLGNEMQVERSAQITANPVRAMYTTSLSYCAPSLVPIEAYRTIHADTVLRSMERASSFPDHFGLVGAFEICADWISRDGRFEAAGSKILDQLLGDMDKLTESCAFYSAAFTMAVPRLTEHKEFRRNAPFWRRLTAAAQASLIVRACGVSDSEKVLKWAIDNFGKSFFFAVLLDGAEESRWKPDWLAPKHLVADAFGRIDMSITKVSEACRPREWVERVDKAREWISKSNIDLLCSLPAIGESRRNKQPTMAETMALRPIFEAFCTDPNSDTLMMCAPGIFIAGVPREIVSHCSSVMAQLRRNSPRWDEGDTGFLVQILAFVALQALDVSLAESVAEFCLEKARELPTNGTSIEIICRLLECASANPDATSAMEVLTRRLEGVAYLSPAETLADLHNSLRHLQRLNGSLSNTLGKAIAASRLGEKAA
jgi:hypothetical protein